MTDSFVRSVRALLSGFFFVAYGLFALPFAALLPLPIWPRAFVRRAVRMFYRLFVFCARITGLFTVRIEGDFDIRGHIVVMNHVSLIDIVILIASLPDSTVIAKAAAKRNPFLSAVVKTVFVANDGGYESLLEDIRGHLAKGVNVIVFPEGTRIPADASEHPLNRGAARIALETRAKIACFHIRYDPPVLGKHQGWWQVGSKIIRISLTNCGIIDPIGENDHHNAVALTQKIKERII